MILASDHGSHMSMYFTFSSVGAIEHKMPLLIIISPKWLTDKYPHLK